MKIFVELREG